MVFVVAKLAYPPAGDQLHVGERRSLSSLEYGGNALYDVTNVGSRYRSRGQNKRKSAVAIDETHKRSDAHEYDVSCSR